MKKWDKIIIVSLLIFSFIPYVIWGATRMYTYNETYVTITVAGKLYDKIKLTGNKGEKEYVISTPDGNNTMLIKGEKVAVINADCKDKVCTEPGFITKPGQSLICLPHKLCITIEGTLLEEDGLDATAY